MGSHVYGISYVAAALILLHGFMYWVVKDQRLGGSESRGKFVPMASAERHRLVLDMTSIANSFILCVLYVKGMQDLGGSAVERLTGTSANSHLGNVLLGAIALYEVFIYALTYDKRVAVWVHHLCVLFFVFFCLATGRLAYYQCWGGLVEGTNLFLCTLTIQKRLGFTVHWFVGVGTQGFLLSIPQVIPAVHP